MRHKGRDVEGTNADDGHFGAVGRKQQSPATVVKERRFRLDTGAPHQRQRLVQYPSLGDCKDDAVRHSGGALGAAR
jgi:hypothetical protein